MLFPLVLRNFLNASAFEKDGASKIYEEDVGRRDQASEE